MFRWRFKGSNGSKKQLNSNFEEPEFQMILGACQLSAHCFLYNRGGECECSARSIQ